LRTVCALTTAFLWLLVSAHANPVMPIFGLVLIGQEVKMTCGLQGTKIEGHYSFERRLAYNDGLGDPEVPEWYVDGVCFPVYVPADSTPDSLEIAPTQLTMEVVPGAQIAAPGIRSSVWDRRVPQFNLSRTVSFWVSQRALEEAERRAAYTERFGAPPPVQIKDEQTEERWLAIFDYLLVDTLTELRVSYRQRTFTDAGRSLSLYTPVIPERQNGSICRIRAVAEAGHTIRLVSGGAVVLSQDSSEVVVEGKHLEPVVVEVLAVPPKRKTKVPRTPH
jgi:hypothetical protein